MSTGTAVSSTSSTWRELYKAALYEPDRNKILERIFEAEAALALRARQLFQASDAQIEERQAIEAAMQFLRILRGTAAEGKRGRHPGNDTAQAA